jgi:hypothetical protein
VVAVVLGGYFLALPVHACGALVIDLHAVHAYVALAGFWVAGDYARESDEAARVFRPALEDGEIEEGKIVALDDFFAGAGWNSLWKELAHLSQHGEHFYFVEEALRGFDIHEGSDAVGDFVQGVDFEGAAHATGGTELVDQELLAGIVLQVFEQESVAACASLLFFIFILFSRTFRNPVRDLGYFENRVCFGADSFQFSGAVERFDPVSQVVVCQ